MTDLHFLLVAVDTHIAGLLSVFQLEAAPTSLLAAPEFSNCVNWCHKNAQNGRFLSSRLIAQSPAVALPLLHAFHICGAIHLLDIIENLFRLPEWPFCISHLCTAAESEAFGTLASLCFASDSDGAHHILGLICNEIATYSTQHAVILRSLLGRIDFSSKDLSFFNTIFSRIYTADSKSNSDLMANWKLSETADDARQQGIAAIFIELVPSSVLVDSCMKAAGGSRSLIYSASAPLVRALPQAELASELFERSRSSLQSRSTTACLPLLLLSYTFSKQEYFGLISRLYNEPGLAESLFEVLHLILPHVSDQTATEHINVLKLASRVQSPLLEAFKSQVTKLVIDKLSSSSHPSGAAAPVVLASKSSESDTVIDRWISTFERTSKPPAKEIGALKIFSPAVLTSTIENLLLKSQSRPDSDSSVKLVLQMAKDKQITGKKYEQWLEFRMAEQRRVMSTRPSPSLKMTGRKPATLEELSSSLSTWIKNMSSGGIAPIGSIVSALLQQSSSTSPASIFSSIWSKFVEASLGDWKARILDLDKIFSSTIVAHGETFYPHLEAAIMQEINESAPNWPVIAISLSIIASHDRNTDRTFLQRVWSPEGLLRLDSKISFQNTLSMLKMLLQATATRFKVVCAASCDLTSPEPPKESSSDLEPASSRTGVLSVAVVQFVSWVSLKLSTSHSDFRFVSVELSEMLRQPSLAPAFLNPSKPRLEDKIEMESFAERLGLTDFSELKAVCDYLASQSNTINTRLAHIHRLFSVFKRLGSSNNPVLSRLIRTSLFDAANGIFTLESSHRMSVTLHRQALTYSTSLGGLENVLPNSAAAARKELLPRSSSVSSLASSPPSSQAQSEDNDALADQPQATTFQSGTNWLLEYFSATLEEGTDKVGPNGKKARMENWLQAVQDVDPRWWSASSRQPQRSLMASFSRFLALYDRLCANTCSKMSFRLLNDCLGALSSPGRSSLIASIALRSPVAVCMLALHLEESKIHANSPQPPHTGAFRTILPALINLDTFSRAIASQDADTTSRLLNGTLESDLSLYSIFAGLALRKGHFSVSNLFTSLSACNAPSADSIAVQVLTTSTDEFFELELHEGLVILPGVTSVLSRSSLDISALARLLPIFDALLDPIQLSFIHDHFKTWNERVKGDWLRAMTDLAGKLSEAQWLLNADEPARNAKTHLQDRLKALLSRLQARNSP